jgi:hypothetical protein
LREVCAGGRTLPSEGTGPGLFVMRAAKGRLQSGGVEVEIVGEEGGQKEDDVGGTGGRVSGSVCYDFELYAISSLYSRLVLSKI